MTMYHYSSLLHGATHMKIDLIPALKNLWRPSSYMIKFYLMIFLPLRGRTHLRTSSEISDEVLCCNENFSTGHKDSEEKADLLDGCQANRQLK